MNPLVLPFFLLSTFSASAQTTRDLVLTLDLSDDTTRRFDLRIETPDDWNPDTDAAVILFSGGLTTDLHWTTPGFYTQGNTIHTLTIDARDIHDSDTIAQALLNAGLAVARYSSIHKDDKQHLFSPVLADPMTYPDTLALAQLAQSTARQELKIDPERTFALAHSLGAPRAIETMPDPCAGFILIAGAYMSPTTTSPRSIIAQDHHPDHPRDIDHSGTIDPFESAAIAAIESDSYRTSERATLHNHEYDFAPDTLLTSTTPVLAIWGSLDPTSYHGPILQHLYDQSDDPDRLTTIYHPDLGHTLGPIDEKKRVGPIDQDVIDSIVRWITARTR